MADYKGQKFQLNKLNPYYEKIARRNKNDEELAANLSSAIASGAGAGAKAPKPAPQNQPITRAQQAPQIVTSEQQRLPVYSSPPTQGGQFMGGEGQRGFSLWGNGN